MDTTAVNVPASNAMKRGFIPVYSPFPMPGSWASINNGAGSPFQRGRIDCAQWTIEDWQELERCYKRLYKKRVRTSSVDKYVWTFEDGTEVIDNLCKLKRITKGELRDEWSRYVTIRRLGDHLLISSISVKRCVCASTHYTESASPMTSLLSICLLSLRHLRGLLSVSRPMTLALWSPLWFRRPCRLLRNSRVSFREDGRV